MFAKVFGQIFDSSIAEDYNCRRMFIDLLVLADPTGAVDMTHEAISRRTNVPMAEVIKYIGELGKPDPASRSQIEDGRRIVPLDSSRGWGWQIVNYSHYRRLKDEEARRSYFRDAQRKYRAKKKEPRKKVRTEEDEEEGVNNRSTLSNVVKTMSKTVQPKFNEWMQFRRGLGHKPKNWDTLFMHQAEWLSKFTISDQLEMLSQSMRNGWQGLFEPNRKSFNHTPARPIYGNNRLPPPNESLSAKEMQCLRDAARTETEALRKKLNPSLAADELNK